jgi:protein-tyrosine phosphatase
VAPKVIDIRRAEDHRDIVHQAVQALAEGQLVALPTETVYGLAASALSDEAVGRLLAVKGRPEGQPLALAVKSADDALDYVPRLSPLGRRLARRCWPGPLTLVVDNDHNDSLLSRLPPIARQAIVPNGAVGLRVPAHPLVLDALRMLAGPVALTSANRSGQPDAVNAQQVIAALGDDVQLVFDDGASRFGQPSSVVRVRDGSLQMLREGVVSQATLRRLSSFVLVFVCTGNTCRSPMAETLARRLIAQRLNCKVDELEEHGVIVASAGLAAAMGGRASPQAVEVMRSQGLDLNQHESQPLNEQLVRHADLILTMTRGHRESIISQWPAAAPRTFVLREDEADVADPVGGPAELYRRCAEQIEAELRHWVPRLEL